ALGDEHRDASWPLGGCLQSVPDSPNGRLKKQFGEVVIARSVNWQVLDSLSKDVDDCLTGEQTNSEDSQVRQTRQATDWSVTSANRFIGKKDTHFRAPTPFPKCDLQEM